MRIGLAADHRGREALEHIGMLLRSSEHNIVTFGSDADWPCDYPDMAYPVATAVATGEVDLGILIDGTGIGMSIAANKVKGVRAALVHDEIGADLARRQMNANVMCIPADMLGRRVIDRIVDKWVNTEFEGGRHKRRVAKIGLIEAGENPQQAGDDFASLADAS